MSKITAKILAFLAFCLAQAAWASTAAEIVNYIDTNSNTTGSLIATASGDTVTVTGTLTAVPSNAHSIRLNIDSNVTVIWRAKLSGAISSENYALIYINGGSGTFSMESGNIEITSGSGRAIWNNSLGAVNISGGTVKTKTGYAINNFSTGSVTISDSAAISSDNRAIYNYSDVANVYSGTVTISGGTVSGGNYAIFNSAVSVSYSGTVIVTGGTVSITSGTAIHNPRSSGTVIVTGGMVSVVSGYAIDNYGKLTVTGGTVSSTGTAIYNSLGSSVTISDSAKITSAGTSGGTIRLMNENTLNINGGTVENTSTGAAIYNNSASSVIRVTGGTVRSAGGNVIDNNGDNSWTVNISGGTLSTGGSDKSVIYSSNSGTTTITGGTISAPSDGYVFYGSGSSASLVLGGDPDITGRLYTYPDKIRVITSGETKFAPSSEKVYILDFPTSQYEVSKIAVMYGANFIGNFDLFNSAYALQKSGDNLSIALASETTKTYSIIYNLDGGTNKALNPYTYTEDDAITLESPTKSGYSFDGWYENSEFTGSQVTSIPEGSTGNKTFYAKWIPEYTCSEGEELLGGECQSTTILLPQIASSQITVQAINGGILLKNLPANTKVELYNLQGKRVYSAMSVEALHIVPLQKKGMYIVKVGTHKFSVVFM